MKFRANAPPLKIGRHLAMLAKSMAGPKYDSPALDRFSYIAINTFSTLTTKS
jgi:hypothetical protein